MRELARKRESPAPRLAPPPCRASPRPARKRARRARAEDFSHSGCTGGFTFSLEKVTNFAIISLEKAHKMRKFPLKKWFFTTATTNIRHS